MQVRPTARPHARTVPLSKTATAAASAALLLALGACSANPDTQSNTQPASTAPTGQPTPPAGDDTTPSTPGSPTPGSPTPGSPTPAGTTPTTPGSNTPTPPTAPTSAPPPPIPTNPTPLELASDIGASALRNYSHTSYIQDGNTPADANSQTVVTLALLPPNTNGPDAIETIGNNIAERYNATISDTTCAADPAVDLTAEQQTYANSNRCTATTTVTIGNLTLSVTLRTTPEEAGLVATINIPIS